MAGTRKDLAAHTGAWAPEIFWYARAVEALRERPFSDRTSWTYLAAIHGFDPAGWQAQAIVPDPTVVSNREQRLMFNQCQHAGWFFLPWHRGYLWAFEEILRSWISSNGGPVDWALPYWNYLDPVAPNARAIPQEFLDSTLPDGTDNPLSQAQRGPAVALGPQNWIPADISLAVQTDEGIYTAEPGTVGYGGPISGFAQQGNAFGGIEANPHNFVHVMIGGDDTPNPSGWMYDPNYAALDPIFWLHHCNIDRLWAAWMSDRTHRQETSPAWGNGPFPQRFTMPDASGTLAVFAPADTLPDGPLAPTYDDLEKGTGIAIGVAAMISKDASERGVGASSLVASNDEMITVGTGTMTSRLTVGPPPRIELRRGFSSSTKGTGGALRVYLNVEGVRGQTPSVVLNLSIKKPGSETVIAKRSLAFFGLANATAVDGPHGGGGLTGTVEVTDQIRELGFFDAADVAALEVEVEQAGSSPQPVTVDRITLYAKPA